MPRPPALPALALLLISTPAAGAPPPPGARHVLVDGRRVWTELLGEGAVTVAFEAGGGNDASVWAELAPKVRAAGARTFTYDRAGLGRSALDGRPYDVAHEVDTFLAALTARGVTGPVVAVAHSYGGAIALLAAARDRRIAGLLLLDALVPGATPDSEIDAVLAETRPQYDEVRREAPALAQAMIPLMEAFRETARTLDAVRLPEGLPITDVVAEHTVEHSPRTAEVWRRAHEAFTAGRPGRTLVIATGSTHKVAKDRPELVLSETVRLADRMKAAPSPAPSADRR